MLSYLPEAGKPLLGVAGSISCFLNGLLVKQRRVELIGNVVEGKGE